MKKQDSSRLLKKQDSSRLLKKLNIGSGRQRIAGFTNIDIVQFVDGNGDNCVDIVMDIEKDALPFEDNSCDAIVVNNVLEHLFELRFPMNEWHRVLTTTGILSGVVPVAGTDVDFKDPTHRRHFIKDTFSYFTGSNPAKPERPAHPKYADYGFNPWHKVKLEQKDNLIWFELSPRK